MHSTCLLVYMFARVHARVHDIVRVVVFCIKKQCYASYSVSVIAENL